jgi:cell division protein FtsI (penicillin-binding protein 3)/stage V sporulation protein D (sporulation-specific penicillin-binding protein)
MNTEDKKRQQFMKRRIASCIVVMFAVCAVVFGRLFWLQVVRGPSLSRRADAQTEESRKIQSPRGTILDRDGRVLAISEMAKSLYADPTMINRTPSEMAHLLAPYLKIKESEIQERLQRDTAFVWLERTMDHDRYEALQQVIKDEKLQGLRFNDENPPLLSQWQDGGPAHRLCRRKRPGTGWH